MAVVRDFEIFGVRASRQDVIFTPFLQSKPAASATLLVRTEGDGLRVAPDIRAAIRAVDASIPQFDVMTMDTQVENSLSQEPLVAILATVFGALALALAAIGLYGVLSYGVTQRTGEISWSLGHRQQELVDGQRRPHLRSQGASESSVRLSGRICTASRHYHSKAHTIPRPVSVI